MPEQARQAPTMQQYAQLWKGGLPDAPWWLAEHGCVQSDQFAGLSYSRVPEQGLA